MVCRLIGVIEEMADLIYVKSVAGGGVDVYRYDPLVNAIIKLGSSSKPKDKFNMISTNNLQYETKVCSHAQDAKNEYALIVGYTLWAGIKRNKYNVIDNYNFDQYIEIWLDWSYNNGDTYLKEYKDILKDIILEKAIVLFETKTVADTRKGTLHKRMFERIKYLAKRHALNN